MTIVHMLNFKRVYLTILNLIIQIIYLHLMKMATDIGFSKRLLLHTNLNLNYSPLML